MTSVVPPSSSMVSCTIVSTIILILGRKSVTVMKAQWITCKIMTFTIFMCLKKLESLFCSKQAERSVFACFMKRLHFADLQFSVWAELSFCTNRIFWNVGSWRAIADNCYNIISKCLTWSDNTKGVGWRASDISLKRIDYMEHYCLQLLNYTLFYVGNKPWSVHHKTHKHTHFCDWKYLYIHLH